ncbi:MAG TPA: carboxypeptidase-like regulatory domain-containing protein, partial [Candidatus Polarisedimenticolia bacterium]|nr:carboxypeptidase-like regulatory domain-containing protein [Candidatus Polarisedimenticolia bacterium]
RRAARDIHGAPIAHAIADASGRFRIEAPAHARVIVAAQAGGHARVRLSRVFETGAPGDDRDLGAIELPAGRPLSGKVVDPAGKPVANAAVLVMPPSRREASAGPAGALLGLAAGSRDAMLPESTTTGPDGSFRFDAAPVAPVTVRVHAGGWAPAAVRSARPAALAPIRLEPGREITGKVLAPDGKSPVEGAWVMAGDQGLDGMSRSRADGSFRLEHVPFAETSLKATVSTASALPEASAGAPGASASWAASLPARLKAAETDGGSSPIVLKLRPGGIVRARILDGETRAPVSGAFVMLTHADPDEASRCVTGASGEVLFTGVPAGAAGLFGQADGYLDLRLRERPVAHEGETRLTAALQPASSLEGMVKDGGGRPIAGAKLTVSGPSPIALPIGRPLFVPLPIDPVETGAEGRFVIESLPARTELKLDIEAPGFAPAQESGISLRAGERRRGVEIRMDSGGTLSGRLIEPGGKPVAAAAVVATRSQENADGGVVIRVGSGGSWSGGSAGARRRGAGGIRAGLGEAESLPPVAPDAEGVFRVRGVRPGIWSLKITAPGRAPRIVAGLKIESTSGFDAGDLVLEPGALIRGRVTGPSGEPVPYARGLVRRQFDMLGEFTTAEDGSFTTEDLVPAEPVTLSVDADGYGPAEKNALVPPIDDLVVTLAASSRVRGQVLDRETRRPVTDFGIRIGRGYGAGLMLMMSGMRQASRFTSEDGTFTLEDVDPGRASLTASAAGLRDSTLNDVEIPEGADLEGLVFLMDRAAAVSGTVVDDRARPVAGVQV